MARRKPPPRAAPSGAARQTSGSGLLDKLSPDEAATVLRYLLDKHPELRPEAQQFATEHVSSFCIEDIARDVHTRITSIDLDALNDRAGSHSWGYVEPSEAATQLLEEAIEDLVEDMKRKAELGLLPAAQAVCAGIVVGLYQARDTQSDGALGWDPDFPGEEAGYVVAEFLRACRPAARKAAQKTLIETLANRAPDWAEDLKHAADRATEE